MPDSTTDPDEVGGAAPSSGARRSGLDRLRAARGGAGAAPAEEGATAADRPTGADRPTRGGSAGSGDRSGSTAVLESAEPVETTAAEEVDASATETAEQGAGATGTRKKGRLRRRGAAADAVSAGAGTARATRKRDAQPVDPARRPPSRIQVAAVVVLTLLIIGLLIPIVLMRHRIFGESKDQKAVESLVDKKTEGTAFAVRFAVTFFSPDYKTVDNYNKTVSAQTTGDFKKDFDGKQGQLKSVLTQAQSQATGKVLTAGASKVSGNTVEVLVVVDQDVKNATTKGKTVTNRYRVRETVQKTGKDWLVQDLEPVT